MKNNPLLDTHFLKQLDLDNQKEVFIKIVSLNKDEEPVESIEGKASGGSINIDGSSAVRRSCSVQLVSEGVNITDVYWGLTTKFNLYIGLTNNIDSDYNDLIWFPQGMFLITAFNTTLTSTGCKIAISGKDKMCLLNGDIGGNFPNPIDFAIELVEYDEKNLNISELIIKYNLIKNLHWRINKDTEIQYLTDEGIAYLAEQQNNESVIGIVEVKDSISGEIKKYKKIRRPITYIIREMIHFYGNEPFHNILIKDVDDKGLELLRYTDGDFYAFLDDNGIYVNITFDTTLTKYTTTGKKIQLNQLTDSELTEIGSNTFKTKVKDSPNDKIGYYVSKISGAGTAGYRAVDLYWPDENGLVVNVGDTITSVLDKICSTFGDYEYFYNLDGQFVFQKKRTYVNQSWTSMIKTTDSANPEEDEKLNSIYEKHDNQYTYNQIYAEAAMLASKSSYNFSDNVLISSFQHTPDFSKIKNNFMIWGKKNPTAANSEGETIHLRYAIDEKPKKYTTIDGRVYRSYDPLKTGEFVKTPNPKDTLQGTALDEQWWDVKDWAELYKLYLGQYPDRELGDYYDGEKGGVNIDIASLYGECHNDELMKKFYGVPCSSSYGQWNDWENKKLYVFDLLSDGSIGYTGHGSMCTHPWASWFDPLYQKGGKAYVYQPVMPGQDKNTQYYVKQNWRELIYQMALDYEKYGHNDDYAVKLAQNNPEFKNGCTGYESYYADLLAYWRKIYNPTTTDYKNYFVGMPNPQKPEEQMPLPDNEKEYYGWNRKYITDPSALEFWMDFIEDSECTIGKYSVKAIGDRPKIVNNDAIKSIIYRDTPNIIYISPEKYSLYQRQNLLQDGYAYIPLPKMYEDKFVISSQGKTTYDELNNLLYQYAYLNEKINLKSVPVYYLEPNTIITVDDNKSDIHGEYILNKITIQLNHNGMMTVVATKAPPRLL